MLLFQVINKVDPGAFYRYATESEDVFFSIEIDAKTGRSDTTIETFKIIKKELPDNPQAIFH